MILFKTNGTKNIIIPIQNAKQGSHVNGLNLRSLYIFSLLNR